MTQETLKPCPFCGGHARPMKCKVGIEGTMGFNKWVTITCSMCEINNGGKGGFMRPRYDTEEEAAKAWNTRADKAVPDLLRVIELAESALFSCGANEQGQEYFSDVKIKQALAEIKKLKGE